MTFLLKGSGNKAFPEWNPQSGLCPLEENRQFQACAETDLFILLSHNSKFHFELATQPLILRRLR